MSGHFRGPGSDERVRYLGKRQEDGPRLLKTVDVYCDTYPWPGGQSLLDAMYAGLPIVAMKAASDSDLDPNRCGPTSAYAEVMLSGVVELAGAGNVDDYVRIALAYSADADLRAEAGRCERARKYGAYCSMERWAQTFGQAIAELVLTKARAS